MLPIWFIVWLTIPLMAGTLTPSSVPFTLAGSGGGSGTLYRASSGLDGSYATVDELFEYSLSENVQHDFSMINLPLQLRRASREADTMLCHRFNTPLKLYSEAFVGWICDIAAYYAMERRGYQPGEEGQVEERRYIRNYKQAMSAIKDTQEYLITPDKRLLLTESPQPAIPVSLPNRMWIVSRNGMRS